MLSHVAASLALQGNGWWVRGGSAYGVVMLRAVSQSQHSCSVCRRAQLAHGVLFGEIPEVY